MYKIPTDKGMISEIGQQTVQLAWIYM